MRPMTGHPGFEDQASRLRRLVRGERRSARVVSVTSGKGGVGKTSIAANVAIALAARGQRVLLLDMDMGLSNVDVILGLDVAGNWWHVLRGQRRMADVVVSAPGGIDLIAGGSGLSGLADVSEFERHRLLQDLEDVCSRYDIVILDCGAGISRGVVSYALAAETIVVVATPEPTSITDAYAMIKVLTQQAGDRRFGLVVNQATSRAEAEAVYMRIAGVAQRFLGVVPADLGYVLADEAMGLAVRRRTPVLLGQPRSAAAACLRAVAGRVAAEEELPQGGTSFLRRVANLFL